MADLTTYLTHIIRAALEALQDKGSRGKNFYRANYHIKSLKLTELIHNIF